MYIFVILALRFTLMKLSTLKSKWWSCFRISGIAGNVTIDANGDRDSDYSLKEMTDIENGVFEVL